MEPLVELQKEQIERDLRKEALADPEFERYYKEACEYFDYFRDKPFQAELDYHSLRKYFSIDWDFDSYYENVFKNEPGLRPLAKRVLRELERAKKISILSGRISIYRSIEETNKLAAELLNRRPQVYFANSQTSLYDGVGDMKPPFGV